MSKLNPLHAAVVLALGLFLGSSQAVAQADGESKEGEVEKPAPTVKLNYAKGHVWMGLGLSSDVVSLSVDRKGTMLALSGDGTLYRRTKGSTWRTVLGATGSRFGEGGLDEEDLLLDAESILEEAENLTEDDDADSERMDEDAEQDDAGVDADSEFEAGQDLNGTEFNPGELTDVLVEEENPIMATDDELPEAVVWASDYIAGVAFVVRPDGVWRSIDEGVIWSPVRGLAGVHQFSDGPDGVLLAATADGVRYSKDRGVVWMVNADPICRIETFDFAYADGVVFAGTAEGLFRSSNGLSWAKTLSRYDTDVPVWAVELDRYWEGGLWVAGPVGILRSDDGGEQLRAAGRNMLPGTRSLLPLDAPGHILAAGEDGVWESRDGGTRWRPIANGLPSSKNFHLAHGLKGPVVGGSDGVHALSAVAASPSVQAPERLKIPEGADMATVTRVALNRPGMAIGEVLTTGSIARALLLPKLMIKSDWSRSRMLAADYEDRSNRGHLKTGWDIGMTACFGGCNSAAGYSSYVDDVSYEVAESSGQVAVVGDEVYNTAGEGSLAPMAANVAERVTRYRTDVANRVSELVLARHRLLEAGQIVRALSLRDRIAHELDVQESTARIDVYTNGYFSRVLQGS